MPAPASARLGPSTPRKPAPKHRRDRQGSATPHLPPTLSSEPTTQVVGFSSEPTTQVVGPDPQTQCPAPAHNRIADLDPRDHTDIVTDQLTNGRLVKIR